MGDDLEVRREADVAVIGGGVTGCGVAWDLSLRGLTVVLVEKGDLAGGTSGRFHGLLHSGARYAVSDPSAALECARESVVLKRIAPRAVDDTGGLFILGPRGAVQWPALGAEAFVDEWRAGCERAGIRVSEISTSEALGREPRLGRGIRRVFEVPDAVCRSIALCASLRKNAEERGAVFLPFHEVVGFLRDGKGVSGLRLNDVRGGRLIELSCRMVVNAAGPWSGRVAELAGVRLRMDLTRGAMIAFAGLWTKAAINILQPSGDGDILLPRGRVSIAGTTTVPTDDPEDRRVEEDEVRLVRERIGSLIPDLLSAKIVHAWSAVRPLYDPAGRDEGADPRRLSRDFTVIDHGAADGVKGLMTIVGGKLTTFRLMAEKTADKVCEKLGVRAECRTAETPLG